MVKWVRRLKKVGMAMKRYGWLLVLLVALTLSACGENQLPPEPEEGVLIYAALNPVTDKLTRSVRDFNKNHPDVQIEIRDYSDEGGLERLQTELVLGVVPDIMELRYYGKSGEDKRKPYGQNPLPGSYTGPAEGYWMPYRQMAQKGYLEDLWPYIENDPELGREGVLEAPLKSAEVNDGLYMLFGRFIIFTLIGRESVVGTRYSWTLDDVMETLAAMPEGSTVLRYNMTKQAAFFNLLSYSLERYVDRKTGTCYFESESVRDLVGFLDGLPDETDPEKAQDAEDQIIQQIKDGRQMLEGMSIVWPRNISTADSLFQERAAFPGYPTSNGSSGSFFYLTGTVLGMSSTCQNKDAAWDYIRTLITPHTRKNKGSILFAQIANTPVNLNDYEAICWYELEIMADTIRMYPQNPLEHIPPYRHFRSGPEIPLMELLTEEHLQRHRDLIDHTTQLFWPEDELANIVWETLGPYFAGDRTLDDTIALLQNRVGLYLNEQK